MVGISGSGEEGRDDLVSTVRVRARFLPSFLPFLPPTSSTSRHRKVVTDRSYLPSRRSLDEPKTKQNKAHDQLSLVSLSFRPASAPPLLSPSTSNLLIPPCTLYFKLLDTQTLTRDSVRREMQSRETPQSSAHHSLLPTLLLVATHLSEYLARIL